MKQTVLLILCMLIISACEKPIINEGDDDNGNVTLDFRPSVGDMRSASAISEYFSKLNIMIFDKDGNKVFDKVKTQLSTDGNFGHLNINLLPGQYTVVSVGHSSSISATIKSTQMVQFTASDGEKLTDTFCYCGEIDVTESPEQHELVMKRVCAMVQFSLTDDDVPESFSKLKIEYTGGSANFNPSTFVGCTKSTQSEMRSANSGNIYQVFTFPYLAESCNLKMILSALDKDGNVIRQRAFDSVSVTRNRATIYTGKFFEEGDGVFTQIPFGFTVNGDWDGEDHYEF